MTAPRHTARRLPQPKRTQPSSAALFLVSLFVALALPLASVFIAFWAEDVATLLAVAAATTAAAMWMLIWATKRRAAKPSGAGTIAITAVVSSAVIMSAYAGITWYWDQWQGPEADFIGDDILVALGAMAVATFLVVYTTLSMAR